MSLSYFIQLTVCGLSLGMVYALVGLGLMLIIRASGLRNFAQGNILAMGAFLSYELMYKLNISNKFLVIIIALCFFIAFSLLFCALCVFPFTNSKWPQTMLIATMGMGTIITEACGILVTRQNRMMPAWIPGSLTIGDLVLDYQYIIVFVIAALLILGVYLLFDKLYIGKILSAAAQNRYAAELLGINTTLTVLLTFIVNTIVVGIAGWSIAPIYLVRPTLSAFQAKAFAGIVIGGWGNLKGSVLGGIIIGMIESYSSILTLAYRDAIVYLFLIIVLIIKPTGLFKGVTYQDKA